MASFQLTFGGVPFVLDTARIVRLPSERPLPYGADEQQLPPRKYQPLVDLVDELNQKIPLGYLDDFSLKGPYTYPPSANQASYPTSLRSLINQQVPIGRWFYPTSASRWSVFRGLATSAMYKEMLRLTGGTTALTFTVKNVPTTPIPFAGGTPSYTVSTSMYMLPGRPLAEHGGKFDGLYLVTLVDARYYWHYLPMSTQPTSSDTFATLITSLQTLLGVTITYSALATPYTAIAMPDLQFWEDAAAMLDSVAAGIGRIAVRAMDGSITLQTALEAQTQVVTNRGNVMRVIRNAGGDIFSSGTKLPAGNLTPASNAVAPANVRVTFPTQGDCASINAVSVPIASGGSLVSGLTGVPNSQTLRTATNYTGANTSGLTSLAMQLASDWWNGLLAAPVLDEVYPGCYNWTPEGLHDIIWTYSSRERQASTRVVRAERQASAGPDCELLAGGSTTTWKAAVRFATTIALPAYTRSGNVITITANGAFPTTDGITPAVGDTFLLKNGAANADNGIYRITTLGTASTQAVATRRSDSDTSAKMPAGHKVDVQEGTINANTVYEMNVANPITLNTTGLTYKRVGDQYLDNLPYQTVNYATTAALPAYTVDSVGVITGTANAAITFDGVTPTAGQTVLVKNETGTNAPYNLRYYIRQVGSASLPPILDPMPYTRNPVRVEDGYVYRGAIFDNWTPNPNPPTAGSTSIAVQQVEGPGFSLAPFPRNIAGLIHRWKFDETSGTTALDSVVGGQNGTISATGVTLGQDPCPNIKHFGYVTNSPASFLFDGSAGRVTVGSAALIGTLASFSISAWIWTFAGARRPIYSEMENVNGREVLIFQMDANGKLSFGIWHSGSFDQVATSNSTINDGRWHFVVATLTAGGSPGMRVYVDGQLEGTATGNTNVAGATVGSAAIGYTKDGTDVTFWFNGNIDDLRHYNVVLTP